MSFFVSLIFCSFSNPFHNSQRKINTDGDRTQGSSKHLHSILVPYSKRFVQCNVTRLGPFLRRDELEFKSLLYNRVQNIMRDKCQYVLWEWYFFNSRCAVNKYLKLTHTVSNWVTLSYWTFYVVLDLNIGRDKQAAVLLIGGIRISVTKKIAKCL